MNTHRVTQPDILAETLRLANAWYFALYGWKPYPPQRPA